jgi:predicted RecB family nuclease
MSPKITDHILYSYVQCKSKAYLYLNGFAGEKTEYEVFTQSLARQIVQSGIQSLIEKHKGDAIRLNRATTQTDLELGKPLLLSTSLVNAACDCRIDCLQRVEGDSCLGPFYYRPVAICQGPRIAPSTTYALTLAAILLECMQDRCPTTGVCLLGSQLGKRTIRLEQHTTRVRTLLSELEMFRGTSVPPQLTLNDNCAQCEFMTRCREQATDTDDLSLITTLNGKQIDDYRAKGITTVHQLSLTFRPRRRRKRVKQRNLSRSAALHALAVRNRKIYVFQKPSLPSSTVHLYLDLEGDPDRRFDYLLGVIVDDGSTESSFSFWADDESQEAALLDHLLSITRVHKDATIFHYGAYETKFLRKMQSRGEYRQDATHLLANSFNILSTLYGAIYFPTYSNGLKDIGGYLGCNWSDDKASGLQSLVWRWRWEQSRDNHLKETLQQYNLEDCRALKTVTEMVYSIAANELAQEASIDDSTVAPVPTFDTEADRHRWGTPSFVTANLSFINQCAYFDYQRSHITLRKSKKRRTSAKSSRKRKLYRPRANRTVEVQSRKCPRCKSRSLSRSSKTAHVRYSLDLRVSSGGVRRWVTKYVSAKHTCRECRKSYVPPALKAKPKFCHTLKAWAMYQHVANRLSYQTIEAMYLECFGLRVVYSDIYGFKPDLATYYVRTYKSILRSLLDGEVLHGDETHINLRKEQAYAWVLANSENVYFFFRPSRDGDFLKEMLHPFSGVFVSDFYSAYDSLPCEQQKCLVHLVRDMNEDVFRNPFDEEFKDMIGEFGRVLRAIVETIDKHGLRSWHLRKHRAKVDRFFALV